MSERVMVALLLLAFGCEGTPSSPPATPEPAAPPPAVEPAPAPAKDATDAPAPSKPPGMLAYVEERIFEQESVKDVRCWSSVQKLQMFLVDSAVEEKATYAKVEGLKAIVHSIWKDASADAQNGVISVAALKNVLHRRFPQRVDDDDSVHFDLSVPPRELRIDGEALHDFDDAIEHWRIVQAWLMDNLNDQGEVTLSPRLSDDALVELSNFVLSYNLAVLSYARHLAQKRKLHVIDPEAIAAALKLEQVLVAPNAPKPPNPG